MPVALLRRSGQLLSSLAGASDQTIVSAVGLLKERANAIATRIKGFVDAFNVKQIVDEQNERPLHVDLSQFSSSVKRVFMVATNVVFRNDVHCSINVNYNYNGGLCFMICYLTQY